MSYEISCCICLESECNYLTECCKNKIHKECIIQWLIYKGISDCPLCRSNNTLVPINDLLSTQYGLTTSEIVNNFHTPHHITINIPEETYNLDFCIYRLPLTRYTFSQIILFLYICIILLYYYLHPNKIEYVDY
jgi:hypothetical protein